MLHDTLHCREQLIATASEVVEVPHKTISLVVRAG